MKKLLLLLVVVGLLGGVGYLVYTHMDLTGGTEVESVLPPDVLFYTKVDDAQKALTELQASPVWQSFSQVNWDKILQTANDPQISLFIQSFKDWSNDPQTKAIFDKFLSKEVALAMYPPKGDISSLDMAALNNIPVLLDTIFPEVYLVTRVEADVQLAELLARTTQSFGSDVSKSSTDYKEHAIQTVTEIASQISLSYVRIKDLLIIGINEDSIKRSIDTYLEFKPPLKNDPDVVAAFKNQPSDADIWTFWDLGKMMEIFKESIRKTLAQDPDTTQDMQQNLDQYLKDMDAFGFVGSTTVLGDLTKMYTRMDFDITKLSALTATYYKNCRSQENRSLKFIPAETIAYQWGACMNLNTYYDQMYGELDEAMQQNIETQLAIYEQTLGMSIREDILPSFGDEWGGYLENIGEIMNFPLPSLALFVEVVDQSKVEKLIQMLGQNPMTQFQKEQHGGATINFIVSPFPQIQPGYAFIDNYFVLAVNKDLLKRSIDAQKNPKQSLASKQSFKDVDLGLTKKSVGVFFAELGSVFTELEGVLDWSKQWMAQKDSQREALKAGARQKLDDTILSKDNALAEIETTKQQILAAEDEVWDLENQGLDTTAANEGLVELEEKVTALEADVLALEEQIAELEVTVAGYDEQFVGVNERDMFMDEFLLPILDGFKAIKALGGYTRMSEDIIDSGMFIQM